MTPLFLASHPRLLRSLVSAVLTVLGALGCDKQADEGEPSAPSGDLGREDAARAAADAASHDGEPKQVIGEAEMLLNLGGSGQVYQHHVVDDWLYFVARLHSKTGAEGVFRIPKSGGEPELVGEDWSGGAASFHSDDEHLYVQTLNAIYRWRLDLSERVEIPLEGYYYTADGDEDSFFATADNCVAVTILDKATLETRTIFPEGAEALGGTFDIVSDGKRLYCTSNNRFYVIDKQTDEVTTMPVSWGGPAEDEPREYWFVELVNVNGRTLTHLRWGGELGYLDLDTGVFSPLTDKYWPRPYLAYQTGDAAVYVVSDGNIWAYDLATNQAMPLLGETLQVLMSTAADEHYVYFVTYKDLLAPSKPIGLMRVRKPE